MSIRLLFCSGAIVTFASMLLACAPAATGSKRAEPQSVQQQSNNAPVAAPTPAPPSAPAQPLPATPAPTEPPLAPPPPVQPQPEGTIRPDDAHVSAAEKGASADDLWFETAETVDALTYGVVGDGKADNTEAFRSLLANGNRTIHVPAGDYVIDELEFAANTILVLEPGVTLRDAVRLGRMNRLLNIRTENVRIVAAGARIIADRRHYQTDEWRHGVYLFGAHNIVIEGLESSSHGGDGFYIGGPAGNPSTDIVLKGCKGSDNRRQGLSITSARRVRVVDCEFTATNGTAPQFGVDLEPNNPVDVLDEIVFVRLRTSANRGGGVMFWLHGLSDASEPVNVTVLDHHSERESPVVLVGRPANVDATIRYRYSN
jgi:hypothetical protein